MCLICHLGFPGGTSSEEAICQRGSCKRREFYHPWVGKIPWRKAWQPTPIFYLENPMDRGPWWATVHTVTKSQIQMKRLSTAQHNLSFNSSI